MLDDLPKEPMVELDGRRPEHLHLRIPRIPAQVLALGDSADEVLHPFEVGSLLAHPPGG